MSSVGGVADTGSPVSDSASAPVRRIAVLRPNHRLGNTVLLSPLLQELERCFPGARIELVTACGAARRLFEPWPHVDTTYTFPAVSYRHPLRVLATLLRLRSQHFDLAIDPIPRSRAGRFLLQWVRARARVGFHWGVRVRDFAVTHVVDAAQAPPHFALAPLFLLRAGYLTRSPGDTPTAPAAANSALPLELRLTAAERQAGEQRLSHALSAGGLRVGLFANASGSKGYPQGWWRELIQMLRRDVPGIQVLEFIPDDGRARLAGEVPGLFTPELRLLAATLAATSLLVIADGGVMHLAEAAGARVLGLFRETAPARYGPYRPRSAAVWAPHISPAEAAERIRAMLAQQ